MKSIEVLGRVVCRILFFNEGRRERVVRCLVEGVFRVFLLGGRVFFFFYFKLRILFIDF